MYERGGSLNDIRLPAAGGGSGLQSVAFDRVGLLLDAQIERAAIEGLMKRIGRRW